MKTVRLIDIVPDIKGNKNLTQTNIQKVIRAIPKVIMKMLLKKEEVKFTPFFKLGFRIAKDRVIKSYISDELLHMPQHLRFKATFYDEFKKFLNSREENDKTN